MANVAAHPFVRAWNALARFMGPKVAKRFSFADYMEILKYQGQSYGIIGTSGYTKYEEIENSFVSYVQQAYKANGVVFATSLARMLLFTQVRLAWQPRETGRYTKNLFWTDSLAIFDDPWPKGKLDTLLARMEQDVTNAGNFFAVRERRRLRRLRPDWVQIVLSAPPAEAIESDVVGYLYRPGGASVTAIEDSQLYLPEEIIHWAPVPDPEAQYRGMSWLTPVLREIEADTSATRHKLAFFRNGAKPGLVVSLKETVTVDQFKAFMKEFSQQHEGVDLAYKTLYLGGGADVTVAGADLKQLDFKNVQGAGETRITAAGGVPAVIVGLSEGLQAATYSNYGQARRKFGDHWAHPQWGSAAGALSAVISPPKNARLWYDARDVPFLREDEKDAAEIQFRRASTLRSYLDAGWTWETAKEALLNEDESVLIHSGLFSVQLQPPGGAAPAPTPDAPAKPESKKRHMAGEHDQDSHAGIDGIDLDDEDDDDESDEDDDPYGDGGDISEYDVDDDGNARFSDSYRGQYGSVVYESGLGARDNYAIVITESKSLHFADDTNGAANREVIAEYDDEPEALEELGEAVYDVQNRDGHISESDYLTEIVTQDESTVTIMDDGGVRITWPGGQEATLDQGEADDLSDATINIAKTYKRQTRSRYKRSKARRRVRSRIRSKSKRVINRRRPGGQSYLRHLPGQHDQDSHAGIGAIDWLGDPLNQAEYENLYGETLDESYPVYFDADTPDDGGIVVRYFEGGDFHVVVDLKDNNYQVMAELDNPDQAYDLANLIDSMIDTEIDEDQEYFAGIVADDEVGPFYVALYDTGDIKFGLAGEEENKYFDFSQDDAAAISSALTDMANGYKEAFEEG